MTTIQLNPVIANQNRGMDAFDLEAERQGQAIRLQNVLRPQKKFFTKKQVAVPVSVANKMN